jgi:hypothetical protein
MSLTGMPLLVSAGLAAVIAAGGTAVGWRRHGRHRFLPRILGILLTAALALLTVGLAVNRAQQFYPSWDALVHRGSAVRDADANRPGRLDRWLGSRFGGRQGQPAAFAWRPVGWTTWHLAGPPTVVVPASYLRHPSWRYSVVLVAAASTTAGPTLTRSARLGRPASRPVRPCSSSCGSNRRRRPTPWPSRFRSA